MHYGDSSWLASIFSRLSGVFPDFSRLVGDILWLHGEFSWLCGNFSWCGKLSIDNVFNFNCFFQNFWGSVAENTNFFGLPTNFCSFATSSPNSRRILLAWCWLLLAWYWLFPAQRRPFLDRWRFLPALQRLVSTGRRVCLTQWRLLSWLDDNFYRFYGNFFWFYGEFSWLGRNFSWFDNFYIDIVFSIVLIFWESWVMFEYGERLFNQ